MEAFRDELTRCRQELVEAVGGGHPAALAELAGRLERIAQSIQADVARLQQDFAVTLAEKSTLERELALHRQGSSAEQAAPTGQEPGALALTEALWFLAPNSLGSLTAEEARLCSQGAEPTHLIGLVRGIAGLAESLSRAATEMGDWLALPMEDPQYRAELEKTLELDRQVREASPARAKGEKAP